MRQVIRGQMPKTKSGYGRSQSGQGVIEGACATWLVTAVTVGGLLLLLNTYVASQYASTINTIASAAAHYAEGKRVWIGVTRPDYDATNIESESRYLADVLLAKAGLNASSSFKLWQEEVQDTSLNAKITVTKVEITVDGLSTIGNIGIPIFSLTGSGMSADAAVPPYGVLAMAIVNDEDASKHKIVAVPCYGVYTAVDYGGTSVAEWTEHPQFPVGDILTPTKLAGIGVREATITSYSPTATRGASVQVVNSSGQCSAYAW